MGAALERHGHKGDSGLAVANYESSFGVRKWLAAQRLQHGFELLCLNGNNWLGGGAIRVAHLNAAHGKGSCPEVRQMQFVHEIDVSSTWECGGLEWHAHLELDWPGSGLGRRLLVMR